MKIVLYTQRVAEIESYGERRDCADQRIPVFIKTCGYLPIPLPNCTEILEEEIRILKPAGLVLTGGNSLVKYGGNAPERDETDRKLLRIAIEKQIPVYGFCRGMQSILDYFGETLSKVENHVAVKHRLTDGNTVNSYHEQACIALKEKSKLAVIAKTEDGVIEAVRHRVYPILGTMWHPERENPFNREDIDRLRTLFQ